MSVVGVVNQLISRFKLLRGIIDVLDETFNYRAVRFIDGGKI
jgi:hypothetical protein